MEDGIPATDEKNALAIVDRLIAQTQCSSPAPVPSPRPAATPHPTPSPTPTDCS
ncbi:MAG: hypothetical protein ABR549_03995 [Mycobacteriales bacterium]